MQRIHLGDHLARYRLVCLCLVLALAACGGGGSSGGNANAPSPGKFPLSAEARDSAVTLHWNHTGAAQYNLFYSTSPDCDIDNYSTCPGGTMLEDVEGPYTLTGLENRQSYWFVVEAIDDGKSRLSSVAGTYPGTLMTSGPVSRLAVDEDGTVYLAGDFDRVGLRSGSVRSFDLKTGLTTAFPSISGDIHAVAPDGEGGVFIGGKSLYVSGEAHSSLLHVDAHGSVSDWAPVLSNDNPTGDVKIESLAMSGDTLYVSGDFRRVEGTARQYLAAFSRDGSLLDWNPAPDASVRALLAQGEDLYVGGAFTSIGGQTRHKVAMFQGDGELTDWTPPDVDRTVMALAATDDTLYLGGYFDNLGESARSRLAALDLADGSLKDWAPVVGSGLTIFTVDTMAVSDDALYVGGYFETIDGQERINLAAFDLVSGGLKDWDLEISNRAQSVNALSMVGDTVYVGGELQWIGGEPRYGLVAVASDGSLKASTPGVGIHGVKGHSEEVYALAVDNDTLYVGGQFSMTDVKKRDGFAVVSREKRLLELGQQVAPRKAHAVFLIGNTLYVAGLSVDELVAIGLDGEEPDFPGVEGYVTSMIAVGDMLVLGGQWLRVDGESYGGLVALGPDGTVRFSHTLSGGSIGALSSDGSTLYAGGQFTQVGEQDRNGLAAFDLATGALTDWNPGISRETGSSSVFNVSVLDMVMVGDTLYVAGHFDHVAGQPRNYAAAFGPEGTLLNWQPDMNATVEALAVQGDTLYLGGDFNQVGEESRKHLAAMDLNDGTLLDWNPQATNRVTDLQITDDGLYAGGRFLNLNGEYSPYFGRVPLAQDQNNTP